MNFGPQTKLEVQGKARHEAARRRNSECKINVRKLYARYHPCLATRRLEKFQGDIPLGLQRSGTPLRCRPTAIAARGISTT